MEILLQFDEYLFSLINGTWHHPFFDAILPIWRNKTTWIPLYIALLGFVFFRFKKNAWYYMIAIAMLMTVSDTLSSKILKKTFERPRPCKTEHVVNNMHILMGCSSSYSFPSSHAVNHFSLSMFLLLTLGRFYKAIKIPLLLWAASIAYAQVYVGVHYPIDVVVGALLGMFLGWLGAYCYHRLFHLQVE